MHSFVRSTVFRGSLSTRGLFGSRTLVGLSAGAALALLLHAPEARAAQTGELQGYVVDESGLPIPGVRVILTSPQMIGGEKIVTTTEDGEFRFAQLEPGTYTVTLSHGQYLGFTESNIQVGIDAIVVRDYLLEGAQGGTADEREVIKVVATAPVVDTTKVSTGASIRPELTDRTPTSRSYQGIALFAPGVVDSTQAPGNPAIHGGTPHSNQYLLDGLNITDPTTSTFSTNFNFDAIAETQVLTGGMDAEYGYTTGGIINIVTKSGGDDFTFDGSVYWEPKELQLLDPGEENDSNAVAANVAVGGPIIRRKLWFFLSGQYVDNVSQSSLREPVFDGVEAIPPRTFQAFYGLGKLRWQPLPWQKFSLLLQGDPTVIHNERQSATVHPDAERQRFQGGAKIGFTSETTLSENLFWKTQLGYGADQLYIFPESGDFKTPGRRNTANGESTVNDTLFLDDRRFRVHLQSHLSYFLENFVGDHEFKAGVEGFVTWNPVSEGIPGDREFIDTVAADPITGEDVVTPLQVKIVGEDETCIDGQIRCFKKTVWGNTVSAFVQDTWRPFRTLTLRPGIRVDSARAYNDPADGSQEVFNFNDISPRLGAAWDPFGDGKTVIRGGYFMYKDMGMLALPGFVGRSIKKDVYGYNPATKDYDIFLGTEGGDAAVVFKDDMVAPTMHEVLIGVQREIFDDTSFAVDFIYRRKNNMFEDDEVNLQWNEEGTNVTGYNDASKPTFIFSLGTPDEAFNQYYGVDFALDKRLSDDWSLLATYTLSRLEGTVDTLITYALDNPRNAPYEFGLLENDVTHRARLTLTYDLPYGIQLGGTAVYLSGRSYSKLFLNEFYGDHLDYRAPRGYDPDSLDEQGRYQELRYPDRFNVNARVAWRLKELTTQDIWLIADVFNVFNSRPGVVLEERNLETGETRFGEVTQRGSPLSVQLGLRYVY